MKRKSFFIIFACFAMALVAQDAIRVNYKGLHPTISDFVSAYVSSRDSEDEEVCVDESFNAMGYAWKRHQKGLQLDDGVTLTVDEKNGYVVYKYRPEPTDEFVLRIEMCYWNETDRRHKLFAYNVSCFQNGQYSPGQFDGITFFRYDNVTKKMTYCEAPGFEEFYGIEDGARGYSYTLPRVGKDIIVTLWYENGKKERTLKWNGHRFGL